MTVEATSERFPPEIEATAYFVACEALTNVVKHAGATKASIDALRANGLRDEALKNCSSGREMWQLALQPLGETVHAVASAHTHAAKLVGLRGERETFHRRRGSQVPGSPDRADHTRVVPARWVAEEVDGNPEARTENGSRTGHLLIQGSAASATLRYPSSNEMTIGFPRRATPRCQWYQTSRNVTAR